MPNNKIELRELRRYDDLTPAEKAWWLQQNDIEDRRKAIKSYDTHLFESSYGAGSAKNIPHKVMIDALESDLTAYNNSLIRKAITEKYSPLREDGTVDPNKGVGDLNTFYKILNMDPLFQKELYESDWKTGPEINDYIKGKQTKNDNIYSSPQMVGTPAGEAAAFSYFSIGRDAEEKVDRGDNDNIFNSIYAKDLAQKEKQSQSLVANEYSKLNIPDEQIDQEFIKAINPTDKSLVGIPQLMAFFNEDGSVRSSEVEKLSADDKRLWIAKLRAYSQIYDKGTAYDMLDKEAKDYLSDHQVWWEYTGALLKDIRIGVSSYTADKINGVRAAYISLKEKAGGYDTPTIPVYKDKNGNLWGKEHVKDGIYTDPYTGEKIPVTLEQVTRSAADAQGIAEDGTTRGLFFNNKYWSDAESTGMFSREEQAKAKTLNGYSPSKAVYKLGQDKDYLWEVAKMMQFALADVAMQAIPFGGEALGAAMQATKLAQGVGIAAKAMNIAGKGIYWTSRLLPGTVGAVGIGHAYGRGVFGETLANNMFMIDEKIQRDAENNISSIYTEPDSNFSEKEQKERAETRSIIDDNIKNKVREYLSNLSEEETEKLGQLSKEEKKEFLQGLMEQAKMEAVREKVEEDVNSVKNSPEYDKMQTEGIESATSSALTAAWTTGLKYFVVNNFMYRKFLYRNPASRTNSLTSKILKDATEDSNGKLSITQKLLNAPKRVKWGEVGKITASQMWGGGWTNFTDELQSAGARRMNEDRMGSYLRGEYDPDAQTSFWSSVGGAFKSYMQGFNSSFSDASTWNAGLVGALGSVTSVAPNFTALASTKFRKAWADVNNNEASGRKKAKEKMKLLIQHGFISNGILNEYWDKVNSEKEAQQIIKTVNNLVDQYDDFKDLGKALALDMASMDASNIHDKDAIDFVNAAAIAYRLNKFSNDKSNRELLGAAQKSSLFNNALETVDKIINDQFTEEDARNYLAEYYAKNPSIAQSEANSKAALEAIKSNAEKIKEGAKVFQEVAERIQKGDKARGTETPSSVTDRLVERFALDQFLTERIADVEEGISGSRQVTAGSVRESYGNTEAINRRVSNIKSLIGNINSEIEKAKTSKDKAEKAAKDYAESRDNELTSDEQKEYAKLVAKSQAAEIQLRSLEQQKRDLTTEGDDLIAMSMDNSEMRVLSKDEILRLSPSDRARMLADENRSDYSSKQQAEIEKARAELALRDPQLVNDVQHQAIMVQRRAANAKAYEMMLNNPEAAAAQIEAEEGLTYRKFLEQKRKRSAMVADKFIQRLEEAPSSTTTELEKVLYNQLINFGPNRVREVEDIRDYDSERLKRYSHVFDKAITTLNMMNDVIGVVDSMELNDDQKRVVSHTIGNMLRRVSNQQGLLDEIGTTIDNSISTELEDSDRAILGGILNNLEEMWNQKSSTATTTKEQRKEAASKAIESAKREAERRKAAEETAKKRALEEKERKAKEEKAQKDKANKEAQEILKKTTTTTPIITKNPKDRGRKLLKKKLEILKDKGSSDIDKIGAISAIENFLYHKGEITPEEYDIMQKSSKDLKDKGYTWDSFLNKPYDHRQKVKAVFTTTDEFPPGARIVTSTFKPAIWKDGKLIQAAEVGVTESPYETTEEKFNDKVKEAKDKYNGKEIIDTSRKSKSGNTIPGKYVYKVGNFGEVTVEFEGSPQAKLRISPDSTGLTIDELIGSKEDYGTEKGYNETKGIFEEGAPIEKIGVATDGTIVISCREGTIEGKTAEKVIKALFGDKLPISSLTRGFNIKGEVITTNSSNNKTVQDAAGPQVSEKDADTANDKVAENAAQGITDKDADTSNDNEAELAANGLTQEDLTTDNESSLTPEQLAEIARSKEGIVDSLESPTIEEQAAENPDKVEIRPLPKDDGSDQGNTIPQTADNLIGNTFYKYEGDAARDNGYENRRKGSKPNDALEQTLGWLDDAGVDLQRIIDDELGDIAKSDPDVHIMYINPQSNTTGDNRMQRHSILVVEYTSEVAGIHNEKNGGVFQANGKQYLMIGILGYQRGNEKQREVWSPINDNRHERVSYFKANPSERFYIDQKYHTKIQRIGSGWRTRRLADDKEVQRRTISELLSDESRNPKGLEAMDLKWYIRQGDEVATVNVTDRNTIHYDKDAQGNNGSVFLLVESSNGEYIPAYINPVRYSEVNEGKLKSKIDELFNELTSASHSRRKAALEELKTLIVLKDKHNDINIGTVEKNKLSVISDGVIVRTFQLDDTGKDRTSILETLRGVDFRINVTTSTLLTKELFDMYDKAGALTTDLAKLGTSNASFSVYAMGSDGNPIIKKPVENSSTSTTTNSDLSRSNKKAKYTLTLGNKVYREWDGFWHNENDSTITDSRLIEQLNYNKMIKERGDKPSITIGQDEVFIINSDKNNPLVIKRRKGSTYVVTMTKEGATKMIDKANAEQVENARKERLKKKVEEAQKKEDSESATLDSMTEEEKKAATENPNAKTVDLFGETLTDDQLARQMAGDFSDSEETDTSEGTTKSSAPTELTAQQQFSLEASDRILNDNENIRLEGDHYIDDSDGTILARATSVIGADENGSVFGLPKEYHTETIDGESFVARTGRGASAYYWKSGNKLMRAEIPNSKLSTITASEIKGEGKEIRVETDTPLEDINNYLDGKDNPWTTPSTTLGTGVHNFIEAILLNKAGNPENYADRFPNMTNKELQALAKEAKELRERIKDKYDIVGTEVTIRGTVEVTDPRSNERKVLDVGGTIDVLLRNKETGKFAIYDFKTKRGAIYESDKAKWSLQQSLYKQMLERKYGVVVEAIEIVPVGLSDTKTGKYPTPKGAKVGRTIGTTEYTTDDNGQLYADGVKYDTAAASIGNNIPLQTSKLSIQYRRLPANVQSMVRTVGETKAPQVSKKPSSAPVVEAAPVKTAEDINKTGTKSLAELQAKKSLDTALSIIKSREYGSRVRKLLKEKFPNMPTDMSKLEDFLASKKISTTGITDVEDWIKMIEECK